MNTSAIILKLGLSGVIFVLTLTLIYAIGDYLKKRTRSKQPGDITANLFVKAMEEKRQFPRADITYPVKMETSQGTVEAETKNISLGGAFICYQKPLPLGENFSLTIETPYHKPLTVSAEVVWSNSNVPDDKVVNRGMGIRFLQITEDDRKFIDQVISANFKDSEEQNQSLKVYDDLKTFGSQFHGEIKG
jgi:uncharacterized protein (TIGR02266 family)